ncbi:hypothetical protein GCM10010112_84700 [Actinoplanes lobatus]|uniref:Ricin B lectin domain-containing protein n=1 Tax=Actinoplanes lobatus TaxID=113568 RepID=A0A7W7MJE5_9ACTN|nr:hypothetical protein [Actinoplanes lobatus]MBB4752373.1 hypothetical protein [Actinoplanes lobatus]GGN94911.1 hypothetical protein GCM10010112_84700 [Actinoplanes lobatus]GIE45582.1 hypothetical protein Alo02nite_84800 [Actinoplanes lobatus]
MKRLPQLRRFLSAALVVTAVLSATATPAAAEPPAGRYYMLVNDSYEKCLSMNNEESPSGAGTKRVYLANCNANTPAQWWYYAYRDNFRNYQNFGGEVWELSNNSTRPAGGGAGTFGAYAAVWSVDPGHDWTVIDYTEPYKVRITSRLGNGHVLSATHNDPYSTGIYRVYTAERNDDSVPPAHLWRYWEHPSGPPACSPCGRH